MDEGSAAHIILDTTTWRLDMHLFYVLLGEIVGFL